MGAAKLTYHDRYAGKSKHYHANPWLQVLEQVVAWRNSIQGKGKRLNNAIRINMDTTVLGITENSLQVVGRFSQLHDEEQRNLHECSYHLLLMFYRKTLSVVYLTSVQDLTSIMHPCQTAKGLTRLLIDSVGVSN